MIESLVTVVHVLTCFFLILVILLQSGKGGGVSAAFGGGAGAALGQRAAATVLGKLTAGGAFIFMLTSMTLAVYSSPSSSDPTKDYKSGAGVTSDEKKDGKDLEDAKDGKDAKGDTEKAPIKIEPVPAKGDAPKPDAPGADPAAAPVPAPVPAPAGDPAPAADPAPAPEPAPAPAKE